MASLLTNIAPAYNPNTGAKAGKWYTNGNKLYMCTKDCTGAFNAANFMDKYLSDLMNGNSNLGGKADLLWTNPSPSASFAAQTVSLDLSSYDGILIEFRSSDTSATVVSTVYVKKGDTTKYAGNLSDTTGWSRGVSCNNTGVVFANAYTTRLNNLVLQPTKIYGVNLILE